MPSDCLRVGNKKIRLENVAEIKYGPVSEKTLFKAQSKEGGPNEKVVGIGIYAKSGASTVELSKKIRERIKVVQIHLLTTTSKVPTKAMY